MQDYPHLPAMPGFGAMSSGFVLFLYYALVRLSAAPEERFESCKKVTTLAIPLVVIFAIIDSLTVYFINYSYSFNLLVGVLVSLVFGLPFIIIMVIDLSLQWFRLKKQTQSSIVSD